MSILFAVLVGLISLVDVSSGDIMTRPGFHYVQRPRLGHFKSEPYTDLYKTYAVAFVLPNHRRERHDDDHRNYAPAGDECVLFFKRFRMDSYELRDLDDMVMLDACLGYLYESTFHDEDKEENELIKKGLEELITDEKLQDLYRGTKVDDEDVFNPEAQDCIGDTLWNAIKLKKQHPEVTCNNHWLQLFIDFAECHAKIPVNARKEDSYAKMLYELIKTRGQQCFDAEIYLINRAVRNDYANNPFFRLGNTFSLKIWRRQAKERMWPRKISNLLKAVQGTETEINLREVHNILKGTLEKKGRFEERLLANLADYANKAIDPKITDKVVPQDPMGSTRYEKMVDKMCNFFRASDNKDYYDYATAFTRMVNVLAHYDVFEIKEKYFMDNVLNSSEESGAMYLSVFSCNVLTFTQAQFAKTRGNAPLRYQVFFVPDTSNMVRWPKADFF